ncbi:MAG: tRNA (adenosine(37)-N6)-threonylcarbamoyltransferase complex dimerization subunit type 1 TsaB [Candidatus Acidiferrum sp.]
MLLLALDTCDSRGSLAILRNDEVLASIPHEGTADYSSWVLPSAEAALKSAGLKMADIDLFAAATGPGSFTGVRIGLTTVKAWSETYGKPVAGVSRLEAMASEASGREKYIAAFVDAHRDQVFGGLYRREESRLECVEQEMVVDPRGFLMWVGAHVGAESTSWISLDPEKVTALEEWAEHTARGESVWVSPSLLAPALGRLGRGRALEGRLTDALGLDAEYVRRSDAEIFWKAGAKSGS